MQKLTFAGLFIFLSVSCLAQINMLVKPDGFLFMEGKDSICFYQRSPKSKNGQYTRCNYIHPLYGLDGNRLTEDFPADHLHHRGVFWAWHQLLIDNKSVSDGWELKNFEQKVSNFEFYPQDGIGIINTTVEWKSPLWKNGAEAFVKEDAKILIYPKTSNYRRFDFLIKLKALTDRFSIGGSTDDKGYSGFSIRTKLPDDLSFFSENGLVEPTTNAVDAGHFIKMFGSFLNHEKKGGVVIWNNPQNPGSSTIWILRKKASMQNAVFPGRQPVSIPFDEPLTLKYTLLVFQGDLNAKEIKRAVK